MKVLITGGAGYLGTKLVEELLKHHHSYVKKVTVYDSLLYKQEGLFSLLTDDRLNFINGDVRNFNKLRPCVEEADLIFPFAALVGMAACNKDHNLAEAVNTNHVINIVNWANHDAKIIYPNTNSGYGVVADGEECTEETPLKPISVYGVTKCAAEDHVLKNGGTVLRLSTVFGVSRRFRKDLLVNDFVFKALTDKYIVLFESHFKRNFIHILDVAEAFMHVIDKKYNGEAYNVGLSSANLSKLELCQKIKEYISDFVIKEDDFAVDFDQRNYVVSNAKLEATGWTPKVSLDMGIQELKKALPIIINRENREHTNV